MFDSIQYQFNAGVEAYWAGDLPENWKSEETRATSPFLTGWYMASMWETQPGFLIDEDGDPLNPDE